MMQGSWLQATLEATSPALQDGEMQQKPASSGELTFQPVMVLVPHQEELGHTF